MAATGDDRPLTPAYISPPASRATVRVGAVAAMAAIAAVGLTSVRLRPAPATVDPCALPAGLDVAALDARDRSWIAHRAMTCRDLTAGRISPLEYRARVEQLDHPPAIAEPSPPPTTVWAARLLGASSQWSDGEWSAKQVLGPPDASLGSDDAAAWASLGADDQREWINVALASPTRLTAVDVVESYNPGAVRRVELTTTSGRRLTVYADPAGAAGTAGLRRHVGFACTDEPIASIKVVLDSPAVSGWNEIDAVGGVPCP